MNSILIIILCGMLLPHHRFFPNLPLPITAHQTDSVRGGWEWLVKLSCHSPGHCLPRGPLPPTTAFSGPPGPPRFGAAAPRRFASGGGGPTSPLPPHTTPYKNFFFVLLYSESMSTQSNIYGDSAQTPHMMQWNE